MKFKNKIILLVISFILVFFLTFLLIDVFFISKTYKEEMQLQNSLAIKSMNALEKSRIEDYNQFLANTASYGIQTLMSPINDIFLSIDTVTRQFTYISEIPDDMLTPRARLFFRDFCVRLPDTKDLLKSDKKYKYSYWVSGNSETKLMAKVSDGLLVSLSNYRMLQYSFQDIIKRIFIVLKDGLVIVTPPMAKNEKASLMNIFNQVKRIPWDQSFLWTKGNDLLLCYVTNSSKTSERDLVIAVEVDYKRFIEFLYSYLSKFKPNNIVIIDKEGKIIAAKSKSIGNSLDQLLAKGNNLYRTPGLSFLKNEDNGCFSFTTKDSVKYQAGFATEKRFGWKLILFSKTKDVTAFMKILREKLKRDHAKYMAMSKYILIRASYIAICFFVFAFIFITIVSYVISRKIINPLNMLREGVNRISKGDLKHKLPEIKTGDEIEYLTHAFNKMLDDLNEHIKTLTETVKAKEKVESDISFAAKVQHEILPQQLEYASKYQESRVLLSCHIQPAITIAGDFYDYFFVDDKHLFFAIGDVSGKGAPASLFMAVIKTYIKDCTTQTKWPLKRILEKTNNSIAKNNYSCMFATLFCGILNIKTGLVKYASAAHEFPLIWRNKSNMLEEIKLPKSTILGAVSGNTKFASGYFTLRPNDLLFLYTDGIVDAKDKNGNFLGKEKLKALLEKNAEKPPEELIEAIKKEIAEFSEGTPQNDDITILALKYR